AQGLLAAAGAEPLMDLGLTGRRALVTGGSRGIGRAIAGQLLLEGARVAGCGRDPESLAALGADDLTALRADVASASGAASPVAETIAALGGIDILVNNVGGSLSTGRFDQATSADWQKVLDTNLLSAVWCSQAAVAWMREHGGGAIVHVSSICGREYCTSA